MSNDQWFQELAAKPWRSICESRALLKFFTMVTGRTHAHLPGLQPHGPALRSHFIADATVTVAVTASGRFYMEATMPKIYNY